MAQTENRITMRRNARSYHILHQSADDWEKEYGSSSRHIPHLFIWILVHLCHWKGKKYETSSHFPVPKGYTAVYVGNEHQRFVIPVLYVNHPAFEDLLKKAEEEFGFTQRGGLHIPCQVSDFQQVIHVIEREVRLMARQRLLQLQPVAQNTSMRGSVF